MPTITIIIPCYNAEKYINKCLDSLEKQTYNDFEVVFIDDCSSDNTIKIIDEYMQNKDLNIKILQNSVNLGPASSRNYGISEASGEYIAFCDSDDWYDDDYLWCMINAARENDADMVLCNGKKVLKSGKILKSNVFHALNKELNVKDVLLLGVDSLWSMIIKRTIISHISMPNLRNGEDMAIIPLLIFNSKRFNIVEKPIYNYFCRSGSLSLKSSENVTDSLCASFYYIYTNCKSGFEREIEFIGIKNLVYGALLNHYKCSKDNCKAKEILDKFEELYPNWYKNEYISTLPIYKRLFVFYAKRRNFFIIKILSFIHKKIFN